MPNDFGVGLDFDSARPIYLQIIDEIKRGVARSSLSPGEKLPSQRDLAEQVRVNPNTVQRAYREMEAMGLVETRRGEGTFIMNDQSMLTSLRTEMAQAAVDTFVRQLRALEVSLAEAVQLVRIGYEEAAVQGERSKSDGQ